MSWPLHIVLLEQLWRIEDNPLLKAAYHTEVETFVIIVLPDKPEKQDPLAQHQRHALQRQLAATLLRELQARGGSAAVVFESVIDAALGLLSEFNLSVFREEDPLITRPLQLPKHAQLEMLPLFTLLHPNDLPIKRERIPDLFKQFKKEIVPFALVRRCNPAPALLRSASETVSSMLSAISVDLSDEQDTATDVEIASFFEEQGGIRRYQNVRQHLQGETSGLALALSCGAISPRNLWWQTRRFEMKYGRSQGAEQFREQLLRRCFYRLLAVKHRQAFLRESGCLGIEIAWQNNAAHLHAWQSGHTGYPLVDAVMRELLQSGWMSNRARRISATFLTRYLGLDWRLGAAWFAQRLVDFDLYNTFGNWQIESGVGEDVRQFRFLDVEHQSERFDPDGDYIKRWVPELAALNASQIHAPWAISDQHLSELGLLDSIYAKPIVNAESSLRANALHYKQALDRAGLKYPRSLVSRFVKKHDRKKRLR